MNLKSGSSEQQLNHEAAAAAGNANAEDANLVEQIKKEIHDQSQKLRESFDAEAVKNSYLFEIHKSIFQCPALENHPMFIKIKNRLETFYVVQEKYK